jgi:hypothetical protein
MCAPYWIDRQVLQALIAMCRSFAAGIAANGGLHGANAQAMRPHKKVNFFCYISIDIGPTVSGFSPT